MNSKIILSHITAVDKNNGIGIKGQLPWDIPKDMAFFKSKTLNKIIIMGRKTFNSLQHPLPQRLSIVVSRSSQSQSSKKVIFVKSILEGISEAKKHIAQYGTEIFIIGGGDIYKQSLGLVDRIYITRINQLYHCDTFYPKILKNEFKLVNTINHTGSPNFSFLTFERL